MFRIIGVILVVAACSYAGLSASSRLKQRCAAIEAAIATLHTIQSEIRYKLTPIPEIVRLLSCSAPDPMKNFYKALLQNLSTYSEKPFSETYIKTIVHCREELCFDKEDLRVLSEMSSSLGRYDGDTQVAAIEYACERLRVNLKTAERERGERGRVWRSLGFGLGVILAIVMV